MTWTIADLPDQTGRRWLITGATNGLGRATAEAAARAGASVVLAVRNQARGHELAASWPGSHEVLHLDLASLDSVRAAGAALDGEIDVLVNNAGAMARRREETADGFELLLGTNLLGPFAFTNLVLPRVAERVVIVASNAHEGAKLERADPHFRNRKWTPFAAYGASKLGDMAWGLALSQRLADSAVGVQLVHPGWVLSNLSAAVGNPKAQRVIDAVSSPFTQSPEQAALCSLFAATMPLPECSYVGPDRFFTLRGHPCLLGRSAAASDPELAEWTWRFAAQETGTDL